MFESELPYSYLLRSLCQFCPILVAMVTYLEETEKEVQIDDIRTNTYHLVKKIVKIGPVDPEIIGIQLKKKKLRKVKTFRMYGRTIDNLRDISAALLRCNEEFNDQFTVNFLLTIHVDRLWKSVNIRQT